MYRCSANRRRISGTSPRYQATISSSDMPSKSGRAARRSVIFAWSASRSVSGGLAKTQPSVAWMSSVRSGFSSPSTPTYGGTPGISPQNE